MLASQEEVRALVTGSSEGCQSLRSRPDSFISLESDPADVISEQMIKCDMLDELVDEHPSGDIDTVPCNSRPLKDVTPTNEVTGDSLENLNEIDNLDTDSVQHLEETSEVCEIVESSDC